MKIRNAQTKDIEEIMDVFKTAKTFMKANGNPDQWNESYPSVGSVEKDIRCDSGYVIIGEDNVIHGYFALIFGEDPTYALLENGQWLNDRPYATLHRIASDSKCRGIFDAVLQFSKGKADNIRIDTHEDNNVMLTLMDKHGLKMCGIIYKEDGTKRIAYQGEWGSNGYQ